MRITTSDGLRRSAGCRYSADFSSWHNESSFYSAVRVAPFGLTDVPGNVPGNIPGNVPGNVPVDLPK